MSRSKLILLILMTFVFIVPVFSQDEAEVTGIIETKEPMAIVNGEIVKEGDVIGELEIVEIGENYVKFNNGYEVFIKRLGQDVEEEKKDRQKGPDLSHYNKAKELYKKAATLEDKPATTFYKKALREAQWALSEVDENRREEMAAIIRDSRRSGLEIEERKREREAQIIKEIKDKKEREKPKGSKRRFRF